MWRVTERERSTGRGGAALDQSDDSLDAVTDVPTLRDHVSLQSVQQELPGGWTARHTFVQFGADPLEDAVQFERSRDGPTLLLKPAVLTEPTGAIEWYEERGSSAGREHVRTVDGLDAALRAAINWAHRETGR